MKIKYIDVTSIQVGQDDAVYNDEAKQQFNKLSKNEKTSFLNEKVEDLSESIQNAYTLMNNTIEEVDSYYKELLEDLAQSISVYPNEVYIMDRYEKQVIDETEQYTNIDSINVKVISKLYTEPIINEEGILMNGYMILSTTEENNDIYAVNINAEIMEQDEESSDEIENIYELYKVGANLEMTSQNLFVTLKDVPSEDEVEKTIGEEAGKL